MEKLKFQRVLNEIAIQKCKIELFDLSDKHEILDNLLNKSEHTKKYFDDDSYILKGILTIDKDIHSCLLISYIMKLVNYFKKSENPEYSVKPVWKYCGDTNNDLECFFVVKRNQFFN